MTSSPAIIFVGKCLTLGKYPDRRDEIRLEMQHPGFSWENVIFEASNQFVLPAWYIQMKTAGLLDEMPEELHIHVEEITSLNRERNLKIIDQANEIAALLNKHGIAPVFLKGTAHLLLGLYNDPAERMIGDIDFLVRENELLPAAELIKTLGFEPHSEYNPGMHREMKHYPRMINYDYPAAIEIHREVMNPPAERHFRAENIFPSVQRIPGINEMYVPGYDHLIVHNMLNAQINDDRFSEAGILLRQSYDLFLLSGKADPQNALAKFGKYRLQSVAWLATSSIVLGAPVNIQYEASKTLNVYLKWFVFMQQHPRFAKIYRTIKYFLWRLWRYISLPIIALTDPGIRKSIVARLTDRKWYAAHIDSYLTHFKPNH
jgi:Uncharacterised nucleotidyltransferase